MNTPKFNIEQQIKIKIEKREIKPSRDLWAEIENQTRPHASIKTKPKWFLIAASLALLFSLGSIFMINKVEAPHSQIVETAKQHENLQIEKIKEPIAPQLYADKPENAIINSSDVNPAQEIKIPKPEVALVKTELPLIKTQQETIVPEVYKIQISNSIAAIDSAKAPVKRKKYVDASTLLFSVEHKDVIENSKKGSNVATIDLNTK